MPDREKLIRALMFCCYDIHDGDCNPDCPYHDACSDGSPVPAVLYDALALLKEQEPRVMTLEELQAIGTQWNRNTPPYLLVEERSDTGSRWMSWGFMRDFVRLWGTMNAKNYGSKWRVWNLQPSPDQMRDTPWEGEKE